MNIDELLVDFDEMGFAPTTLCENPEEYACEWKKQLLAEIDKLKIQLEQANAGIVNCIGCKLVEINVARDFAEKVKEKAFSHCRTINCYECKFIETTIDDILKEYEE